MNKVYILEKDTFCLRPWLRVTEARRRAAASPHYSVVTGWTQMDVWALGCAEFVK